MLPKWFALGSLAVSGLCGELDASDCSPWDETRTCASPEEVPLESSLGSGAHHSLLQVKRPRVGVDKVKVASTPDASIQQSSRKDHISSTKTAAGKHIKSNIVKDRSGISFIQMAESVVLEGTVVTDGTHTPSEEVRTAWFHGFSDAALIAGVLCSAVLYFISVSLGRTCFGRVTCSKASKIDIELPEPKPSAKSNVDGFKEPLLPGATASFIIPLRHDVDASSAKDFCFKIPRCSDGPELSARVKCNSEGSTAAKIHLCSEAGSGLRSPIASCSLVNGEADIESCNIQGAMMSWLSLLRHEKEGVEEAPVAIAMLPHDASSHLKSRRVSLCGIAEDLLVQESPDGDTGTSSTRLEVSNGLSSLVGHLEPCSSSSSSSIRYNLVHQGGVLLDIEAHGDGSSVTLRKLDRVVALASRFDRRRNPEEPPEPIGDEDENIQVDVVEAADGDEIAVFLICLLAMIVFRPKANIRAMGITSSSTDDLRPSKQSSSV